MCGGHEMTILHGLISGSRPGGHILAVGESLSNKMSLVTAQEHLIGIQPDRARVGMSLVLLHPSLPNV